MKPPVLALSRAEPAERPLPIFSGRSGMHFLDVERSCKISGGTSFRLSLIQGLVERGHEFTLASRGGPMAPSLRAAGARILRTPPYPFNVLPIAAYAARHPADVYLCAGRGRARLTALRLAKWTHKPCICVLQDPPQPWHTVEELLQPTVLVTVEPPVYEAVVKLGVPPEQVRLWPRPVRSRVMGPPPGEGFTILHLGRLSSNKWPSVATLIDSLEVLLPEIEGLQITVAGGGGKAEEVATLAAAANARYGREVVKMLGEVLDPLGTIEASNLVVAGGYSCFEALYNGRPAIGSGFGWFGAITAVEAAEATALHFGDRSPNPHTTEAMSQAILAVYQSLSQSGGTSPYNPQRSWFHQDHSMEHSAQLMEELALELLSGRGKVIRGEQSG